MPETVKRLSEEALTEIEGWWGVSDFEKGECFTTRMAMRSIPQLIAELRAAREREGWQKIGRFPESPRSDNGWPKGQRVLVWGESLGVRDGEVFNTAGHIHVNVCSLHGNAVEFWGVTHYMPLPQPPGEGKP